MKKLLAINLLLALFAVWLSLGSGFSNTVKIMAATATNLTKTTSTGQPGYLKVATPGKEGLDVFYNWEYWPHSAAKRSNDLWPQFIEQLKGPKNYSSSTGNNPYNTLGEIANTSTMTDINGDGLTDMIFRDDQGLWGTDYIQTEMAVWLNKGNNSFQLIYKCMVTTGAWYGDCAQQ